MLKSLMKKNRSYRVFDESYKLEKQDLVDLIELARLSPCGKNAQSLRFMPIYKREVLKYIYPYLTWAAYLKEWDGPIEGERPTGIILILSKGGSLNDPILSADMGIASQSMLLGAVEKNLGGCMIRAINRKKISEILNIYDEYTIHMALAIGKPNQRVIIEDIEETDDIKYWMDDDKTHHVPKIKLEDLIIE